MFSKFNKRMQTFFKFPLRSNSTGTKEYLSNKTTGYVMTGLGFFGLFFLVSQNKSRILYKSLLESNVPIVIRDPYMKRTRDTMLCFSGCISLTSLIIGLMLRSPLVLRSLNTYLPLILTVPTIMFSTWQLGQVQESTEKSLYKKSLWLALHVSVIFTIVPLANILNILTVRDAFLLASGIFGGLTFYTLFALDEQFMELPGFNSAIFGGISAFGVANILLPSSSMYSLWLYGVLLSFVAMVIYDMRQVYSRAEKCTEEFDPMSESAKIYLDILRTPLTLLGNKEETVPH